MNKRIKFSKETLEENQQKEFLRKDIEQSVIYVESSGTSGVRGYGWYGEADLQKMSSHLIERGVCLSGKDTIMIRFPYTLSLPAHFIEASARYCGAVIVPVSSRTEMAPYFKLLDLMRELEVTVFAGNPRELEFLFESLNVQQLTPKEHLPKLRALVTAGEVLSCQRKKHLEKIWGVPVYNLYGATEVGNFGYTCKDGKMHMDEERFLIRKEVNTKFSPLEKGINKTIYITNIINYTSKIENFKIEDVVEVLSDKCSCGDQNALILTRGRIGDLITTEKKEFDMYTIQQAVYSLMKVPFFWEVHVNEEKVEFRLEYNLDQKINKVEVESQLKEKLGLKTIQVQFFGEGELIDRGSVFQYPKSRKPIYIYNVETNKLKTEIERGKVELQSENYKKAKSCFKSLINEFDSPEAYIWMAAALGLEADAKSLMEKISLYPSLKKYTEAAMKRNPYDAFAHYLLAMLLYKTPEEIGGDRKKALKHFRMSKYLGYQEDLSDYLSGLIESIEEVSL